MQQLNKNIFHLWQQYVSGHATPKELDQLLEVIRDLANDDKNIQMFQQSIAEHPVSVELSVDAQASMWNQILQLTGNSSELFNENLPALQKQTNHHQIAFNSSPVVHRVHFLKTIWFRYAAAVILLFGIGTAVVVSLTNDQKKKTLTISEKPDILPGGSKAVLTLSDGTTITLDSVANGTLAQQGNAQIVKLANGKIAYHLNGAAEGDVMINTMRTPRGGQYQLTLPDGTKVWLNAASSITYPAIFVGNDRKVSITGEAYMEVAKNPKQSFVVTANGTEVQVLGTSFNVNAYEDETAIKTTLISGSVKVKATTAVVVSSDQQSKADQQLKSVILKPGQQAILKNSTTSVGLSSDYQFSINEVADIQQVLAWKNGIFNFQNADLHSLMKQIERWYDVQVEYEGAAPKIEFGGKVDRAMKLSDLTGVLNSFGIHTRLEGRTLIVEGS